MALAVQPGGVVHAFEPQPGVWEVLRANADINGLSRVIVAHNAAVGGPPSPSTDAGSASESSQQRVCLARDTPTRQDGSDSSGAVAGGACTSRFVDVPLQRMGGADEDPRDECGGVVVRLGGNFGGLWRRRVDGCSDGCSGRGSDRGNDPAAR
jgi:hypothetical protein